MLRKLLLFLFALTIGTIAYAYRYHLITLYSDLLVSAGLSSECSKPIEYSIGTFDERFGISKTELKDDLAAAEKIWEGVSGRDLFKYSSDGALKINLTYDYRQTATDKLKSIGIVINNDKTTYYSLKNKYDELISTFSANKASLERDFAKVNTEKAEYEKDIAYWNAKGGAPKNEYQKLDERRKMLNSEINSLNARQERLKDTADTINSLATVINQLITKLNLNVEKYNSTTNDTGEEFNEGEYVSDASGQRIDIYQFSNDEKLLRVLAHELGHALGLEHVDDPKAIMYKLNQGDSKLPTVADVEELDRVCGTKK